MKQFAHYFISALIVLGAFWASGTAIAAERSIYAGKTLRFVVPFNPGGGFDFLGRVLSRHMPNFIAGKPNFIVENRPGGGGIVGANYLYNVAKPDGLTFGLVLGSISISQLTNEPGIKVKMQNFKWVGAIDTGAVVLAIRKDLPINNLAELRAFKKPLYVASSSPGNITYDYPVILNHYGGLNFKMITSYRGTRSALSALMKREVDGRAGSLPTMLARYPKDLVKIFIGNDRARKVVPGIISDLGIVKSKEGQMLIWALTLPQQFSKGIVAPPKIPSDRLAALRSAWNQVITNKRFLDEAVKLKIAKPGEYVTSDKVERLVGELFAVPQATWDLLKKIRKK